MYQFEQDLGHLEFIFSVLHYHTPDVLYIAVFTPGTPRTYAVLVQRCGSMYHYIFHTVIHISLASASLIIWLEERVDHARRSLCRYRGRLSASFMIS